MTRWLPDLPEALMAELNEEFDFAYSESWAVYADLLQDQNHPLGLRIAESQASYLRDPAADATEDCTGPHEPAGTQRHGFWRTVELDYDHQQQSLLQALLEDESCRFLRSLSVCVLGDLASLLETLIGIAHGLPSLESLEINVIEHDALVSQDLLSCALAKSPKLASLAITGSHVAEGIADAKLVELSMDLNSIDDFGRERTDLPSLRRLRVNTDSNGDIRELCGGIGLPRLTELQLRNPRSSVQLTSLSQLVATQLLPQLTLIGLPTAFSEEQAEQLCIFAKKFGLQIGVERRNYPSEVKRRFARSGLLFQPPEDTFNGEVGFQFGLWRWCEVEFVRIDRDTLGMAAHRLRSQHPAQSALLARVEDIEICCFIEVSKEQLGHALHCLERHHRWLLRYRPVLQELLDCCRRHEHAHTHDTPCPDLIRVEG